MGMFQRTQDVSGKVVDHGDGPGSTMECLLESFPINPIPHPVRQVTDDPGIVYMADGGVIQPAQCFRFPEKPGAGGGLGMEVRGAAAPRLRARALSIEEHLLRGRSHGSLQPVAGTERVLGALEIAKRLYLGQRSNPRRRSTLTSRPHTVA